MLYSSFEEEQYFYEQNEKSLLDYKIRDTANFKFGSARSILSEKLNSSGQRTFLRMEGGRGRRGGTGWGWGLVWAGGL